MAGIHRANNDLRSHFLKVILDTFIVILARARLSVLVSCGALSFRSKKEGHLRYRPFGRIAEHTLSSTGYEPKKLNRMEVVSAGSDLVIPRGNTPTHPWHSTGTAAADDSMQMAVPYNKLCHVTPT